MYPQNATKNMHLKKPKELDFTLKMQNQSASMDVPFPEDRSAKNGMTSLQAAA
jgi:hypothetical protein